MTPPQPQAPVMTLEETIQKLTEFTDHQESLQQFYTEPLPGTPVLHAALHHLEAGRRVIEVLAKGEMECGHCTRGGETYDQFAARHLSTSQPVEEVKEEPC